jgi:PKD repeat protein
MRRRLAFVAVVTGVVVVGLAVSAAAVGPTVTFQCCQYSSPVTRIAPGGSVTIQPVSGVTFQDHPLVFVDGIDSKNTNDSTPVTRTFAAAGVYQFYCGIHGGLSAGNVVGMSGRVVVTSNVAPSASFTVTPAVPGAGETVTLDGGASTDDHAIAAYRWDFNGDGTVDETDTTPVTTHVFGASTTVTLTVVDDNADAVGPESDATTRTVTVPVATLPPGPGTPPGTGPGLPGPGPSTADRTAPHVSLVTRALHLSDLRGGRAKLAFTSSEAGSATATIKLGATTVAAAKAAFTSTGRHSLTLKLTATGKARLRHAKRASLRISLVVSDGAGNRAAAKTLSLAHVT